jgi:hypothetical protein
MTLEKLLKKIEPKPTIRGRVWAFFYLLFHKEEGDRLLKELQDKVNEMESSIKETTAALNAARGR